MRVKVVIVMRWTRTRREWTQWSWRNEEGSWFHRWGDAYLKERLVICNEEDKEDTSWTFLCHRHQNSLIILSMSTIPCQLTWLWEFWKLLITTAVEQLIF